MIEISGQEFHSIVEHIKDKNRADNDAAGCKRIVNCLDSQVCIKFGVVGRLFIKKLVDNNIEFLPWTGGLKFLDRNSTVLSWPQSKFKVLFILEACFDLILSPSLPWKFKSWVEKLLKIWGLNPHSGMSKIVLSLFCSFSNSP